MNTDDLHFLCEKNILTSLDVHFAFLITRLSGTASPELTLAAALVSKFTQEGHTCLDLSSLAGKSLVNDMNDARSVCPDLLFWRHILEQSTVVGRPGDFAPLILDAKSRLYLFRYWEYEKNLADAIRQRAEHTSEPYDTSLLIDGLNRLFPENQEPEIDWQKIAAATAVMKRFTIISGGPGTGKTTTIVKVLALLVEQARDRKLRIALAAPTGKAAARLQEAIKKTKKNLNSPQKCAEAIPDEATTIHRLLGSIPGSPYFRYNSDNQLPVDVVVIDEVSMVSLSLMARLNDAVPRDSRMIFVGDQDQLASVEPGAVLGDICDTGKNHTFSLPHINQLKKLFNNGNALATNGNEYPGLHDSIVQLQKSFRFKKGSGIGELSFAVNSGESNRALSLLQSEQYPAIEWKLLPKPKDLFLCLREKVRRGFGEYLKTRDPGIALSLFERFRILCALREGPYGVSSLNFLVEQILKKEKLISPQQKWYPGRPIMITRNDYSLKLFNGDAGIILAAKENSHELRSFFLSSDGTIRKFPLLRLPEHETVYALTVHKSQGSEFDDVLVVLPDIPSPVLTRELIYTAITRAKKRVEIWGIDEIFKTAISSRIERTSGLRDILWGEKRV